MTQIVLDGVSTSYKAFTLGPVDAVLEPGVTALLGANGAGKSTLMRLTLGLARPSSGTVSRRSASDEDVADRRVGYLPQDFAAPSRVTVRDWLRYVAWCRSGRGHRLSLDDVDEALARVDLTSKAEYKIRGLSGGMLRRLGIAQAILGGADVLVLDEPTVGLDPVQRRDVRTVVAGLAEEAVVLLSTHLSEDVAAIASRVMVMSDGRVEFAGTIEDLVALGGADAVSSESVERAFLHVIGDQAVSDAA